MGVLLQDFLLRTTSVQVFCFVIHIVFLLILARGAHQKGCVPGKDVLSFDTTLQRTANIRKKKETDKFHLAQAPDAPRRIKPHATGLILIHKP